MYDDLSTPELPADAARNHGQARAQFDPAMALGALSAGVLVVGQDWKVLYGNEAALARLGITRRALLGNDVRSIVPALVAGSPGAPATLRDGVPREYRAEVAAPGGFTALQVRVCRDAARNLLFELFPGGSSGAAVAPEASANGQDEENAALRVLARQMAELPDSERMLRVLCEAAWAQCGASGAAVAVIEETSGRLAVGVGALEPAAGIRFPLEGSVAADAIQSRAPVTVEDFTSGGRPLSAPLRRLGVGPVLVAPLISEEAALGVIAVVRPAGAASFSQRDVQRLQVIADHASLAIWKAQLLERARAADAAKGRFLATMSHELRTPLTALTGYGELLADQVIGPLSEAQLDILDRMRSVTHHLSAMIEEILAFSSLEAGRETVRPTEFLAADLLTAVLAVVEPMARQKELPLETVLPRESVRITSDIDKVRQVLVNLASNAVKFTEQGRVTLSMQRESDTEVRFSVADTGVGIEAADLPLLFRPFTQLDTSLTRKHGGTGLGLYISRRVATLLGGRIEVRSTRGEGSTFSLVLPTG